MVAGELCAGVVLGPSLLGHVDHGLRGWVLPATAAQSHLIDGFGQFGVVLLVGVSGMHLNFGMVRRETRTVLTIGAAGVIVPLILGVCAGLVLPATLIGHGGGRDTFAVFLGMALAVSAIPVIAKILLELELMHRDIGQLTLAASIVDDSAGWILLSAVSAFVTVGAGQRAGHIAVIVASLAGVIAIAALVVRPLAVLGLRWLNHNADPALYTAAVVTAVLFAAAGTDALGLEPVFGAFTCGVVIASTGELDSARIAPLTPLVMGCLAPVFFATAGLRMNLDALGSPAIFGSAVFLLLIAVAGKFAGAYAGARLSKRSRREAIALGAGLNARGMIQIVIASVGLSINVLNTSSYTIIVLIAIATSMMAGPILRATMRNTEESVEEIRTHPAFHYMYH
jgi:Kef-type K+ transport system membrane component KefB